MVSTRDSIGYKVLSVLNNAGFESGIRFWPSVDIDFANKRLPWIAALSRLGDIRLLTIETPAVDESRCCHASLLRDSQRRVPEAYVITSCC
jgi:hypothetical protein